MNVRKSALPVILRSLKGQGKAVWLRLAAVAGLFAIVGVLTLSDSSAASFNVDTEAEAGATSGLVSVVADHTASGGSAVKFGDSEPGGCPPGQTGLPPNCGGIPVPTIPTLNGKQWKLAFNEEFNGSSLDTTKLSPCFDWNGGDCTASFNQGKERYSPSQVRVGNGTAKLVAEPLSPPEANNACFNSSCTYKAGLLSTARPNTNSGTKYLFPFTYGYVESRMKYPAVPGFFTAFWMLPTDPTYNYKTEIDIAEILGGYPSTIFMHYHYNNRATSFRVGDPPNGPGGTNTNGACDLKDYSKDFVRLGMDWEPTYIAWYIDGVKCGQFDGDATTIESGPMQIILHMMVDNSWERDWNSVLSSQDLTNQLEVDYLRVFQQQ